jgi:2-polyprenyl-6-methoxyphenol hydroxylase-like FAD-dependent oxidoreductase
MNMNRADEKITADVLVGADGLARAIRFVQAINEPTTGLKPEMKGTSNE